MRHALEGGAWRGYTVGTVQEKPMAIDTDTARKVAKLARIRVEEADLPALAQQLSGILGFMEQLNEVDVTGVEPMTSVTPMRLRRRADVVTDGDIQAQILKNAPDAREGFFAVPKVVE
jgi:aspartyl-tRNA(Asn)/glutamyl-tRNA(Gln) amidotransferase subunit C